MGDLQDAVRHRRPRGRGHGAGKDAGEVPGRKGDKFPSGFGAAAHPDIGAWLTGQIVVHQSNLDLIRRAIRRPIKGDHAFARRAKCAGNHQRKILIHGAGIAPRILNHPRAADADAVFADDRYRQMYGFDVVNPVRAGRVGKGFPVRELVAPKNFPRRRNHFQVEIIDQGNDCGGQSGHVRVSQRDLQRFFRAANQHALFEHRAVGEQDGLVGEMVVARRADQSG
ncbi:MAG: hypothetical protein BWX84_02679 [Verrucomicrobia bacterium ADurb.Bin118]|nr:MAG: hypothetical protein BWX84_02679 [Verrucomicrobia bacterium ADurb.Bin118]